MKQKINRGVIIFTIIILGLLPTSTNTIAVPMLKNGIGVHSFNFSEVGDSFISEGYITIINSGTDKPTEFTLVIDNNLKPIDLNENGEPRNHTINKNITFLPLTNTNWISLEKEKITIPGEKTYKAKYTIEIPIKEVYDIIDKNISKGFLCYINVKGKAGNVLQIDYNYKLFITFEGKLKEQFPITIPVYVYPLLLILLSLFIYTIYSSRKKQIKGKGVINEK